MYILKGFSMLTRPGLRRFVIIPVMLNILLFSAFIVLGIHYFSALINWINAYIPTWLQWLDWLLWILFAITQLIITTFAFTLIANFIAAPFNGLLSEKVQLMLTGKNPTDDNSWQETFKAVPRSFFRQLKVLWYYLPRLILLLILSFIPLINIIVPILWFVFNSWMMGIQYLDFPMDNNRVSFMQMRMKMENNRMQSLYFGGSVLALTMIPIVNFFVMPAAVIGATLFWIDTFKN